MHKLLVDTPIGEQKILIVGQGGGYFDASRIVWDDRVDGPLDELAPGFQLGGMIREGGALVFSGARNAEHAAATAPAVPSRVEKWAGCRALIEAGIELSQIDAYIAAVENAAERAIAASDWASQTHIYRSNSLVTEIAAFLGFSSSQLDALFVRAKEIETTVNQIE